MVRSKETQTIHSLLIFLLSFPILSLADEIREIRVEALPQTFTRETKDPEPTHHYFSGQTIEFPLVIDGASEVPVDLRATLFQLSSSIEAPVGVFDVFKGRVINQRGENRHSLSMVLPEVRQEAHFELRFEMKGESQEDWQATGKAGLIVYPKKLLEPLKAWSERVQLRVKDSEEKLSGFLSSQGVQFLDYRSPAMPSAESPAVTLVVRGSELDSLPGPPSHPHETVILFNERVNGLPKIVVAPHGEGTLVEVDLEVLQNLGSDPRVQRLFLEIVQLSNQSSNS